MKKKFLIPLLIVICALFCAFSLAACDSIFGDEGNNGETEQGGNQIENNGNTDNNGGNDDDDDDDEPPHSHIDYMIVFHGATCTEPGYEYRECFCGYNYKVVHADTNPALGHNEIVLISDEATCTKRGYTQYGCTRCDYTGVTYTDALGHNLATRKSENATCTERGYTNLGCTRCTYTKVEYSEALGHNTVTHEGQEATCSQSGWEEYETCTRCDYSTYTEIPPLEHEEFVWTAVRSYCAYACTECGYVQESAVHNFESSTCTVCGITYNTYLDTFNGKYGFEYFSTMQKGESLQALYSDIDYEVRNFHENGESVSGDYSFATINYSDYGLTYAEAVAVWKTYHDDNPLYYWFSNSASSTVNTLSLFVNEEFADGEVRTAQNQKLYEAVKDWVKTVENETSAYMKAMAFHDAIINTIDYAYDGAGKPQSASWAHDVLGVFEEEGGVCESYAKTFQLLLNVCGVENIFVSGIGNREAHAWNLIKLDDGNWYWCDLTWDDNGDNLWGLSHNYFCATDESFLARHTPDTENGKGVNFLYGLPARAEAAYAGDEINYHDTFSIDGLKYLIIGYNSVSVAAIDAVGDVEIPAEVSFGGRGYKVVALGEYRSNSFEWATVNNEVTSVFIPATVKFIASNTLCYTTALEEITVDENNLKYRSVDGVLFTKSLEVILVYPNARQATSYTIPEECTKIGYHAFGSSVHGERRLERLIVHSGVSMAGVADWGGGFHNIIVGEWGNIINSLTGKHELIIDENNPYLKVKDGLLFNSNYSRIYTCVQEKEVLVIPETVKDIESGAFWDNDLIKNIVLPEGWTSIKDHQFTYCSNLESIYIPDSVKSIGNSAFFGCGSLKSVTLPEGLTDIGEYAFCGCKLESVTIPNSVSTIGKRAFVSCRNLLSVTLGTGLTEIGEDAFLSCDKLLEVYNNLSSLEITKGSTENGYVGYYAECIYTGLDGESKVTVTADGFIFFDDGVKCLLVGYKGEETELVLPESFNGKDYDILGYAFYRSEITKIVISSCVKTIGEYAFYSSNLAEIVIENGTTTICSAAFMHCENLVSVKVPASVKEIQKYAFCSSGNCIVYFNGTSTEWYQAIDSGAFWETKYTLTCEQS